MLSPISTSFTPGLRRSAEDGSSEIFIACQALRFFSSCIVMFFGWDFLTACQV